MRRYAMVVRLKPEAEEEYRRIHQAVWPEVLETIRQCNIRNYSIFLRDGFLFGYFEYHGEDLEADFDRMAADPKTQEWWFITKPMQERLPSCTGDEWWAEMEEVFHMD